jgi:hypothetical protein
MACTPAGHSGPARWSLKLLVLEALKVEVTVANTATITLGATPGRVRYANSLCIPLQMFSFPDISSGHSYLLEDAKITSRRPIWSPSPYHSIYALAKYKQIASKSPKKLNKHPIRFIFAVIRRNFEQLFHYIYDNEMSPANPKNEGNLHDTKITITATLFLGRRKQFKLELES